MVFSSTSDYFDPPSWHQQANQPQPSGIIQQDHSFQVLSSTNAQQAAGNVNGNGSGLIRPGSMLDRARIARVPLPEPGLKCPRCDSTNTKFCYFNNYNLTQPRHFCKACRRYWTRGGALRNVPVGGGFRRNKRSKARAGSTKSTSVQPAQKNGGGSGSGLNNNTINNTSSSINACGNGNGNGFVSQMNLSSPANLPYVPGLHHLNGYQNGFGLNLGGGTGFAMGASLSTGVPRVQQYSNLLTGNGLYLFSSSGVNTQLDHGNPGFASQNARLKAEENQGLNLSKNIMSGIQENIPNNDDDQYSNWGSGNVWTDNSGFNSAGTSGFEGRT